MKKFLKTFVLCLVVVVFAVVGFAGCGKKIEGQAEETLPPEEVFVEIDDYTSQEFVDFVNRIDVATEFLDGYKFSYKGSVLFGLSPYKIMLGGRIQLFARGVFGDFNAHVTTMDGSTTIDIVGYVKDDTIYAQTKIKHSIWSENGDLDYAPSGYAAEIEGIFEMVEKIVRANETDVVEILSYLDDSALSNKTKIYSEKTGCTTYSGMADVLLFAATFNEYNELVSIKTSAMGTENSSATLPLIISVDYEAIDHSERIAFPDDLDTYVAITK